MNIYYITSNSYYDKYNFTQIDIEKTSKKISDIQKEILSIPEFCRGEESILTSELKSYLVSGISFFTEDNDNLKKITGLINFDVNQDIINILGLCVPGTSSGIGSLLLKKVINFSKYNNIKIIKLICYDNVKKFYEKHGFIVKNESTFYDSDEDSDDSERENKIKYEMIYKVKDSENNTNSSGGSKKKKTNKKKTNKKKTMKKKTNKKIKRRKYPSKL